MVEKACGLPDFVTRLGNPDDAQGQSLTFSPVAKSAIESARLQARLSSSRQIAEHHLIVALTFPFRAELRGPVKRVWQHRWTLDVETLRSPLKEIVARELGTEENQRN